jgi:DNA-binding beta-propeller fold protein YncE
MSRRTTSMIWAALLSLLPSAGGGLAVAGPQEKAAATDSPPLQRVRTIALKGPVGGLDHLALDIKRGRLFVANTVNGSLDVVDLKAGRLLKQVPGQGGIRGIDYDPGSDRVFVGNGTGGICNVFDGESYELLKSIPLGEDADNVRHNPRTGRIYVVHADKELAVIDAKGYSVLTPIALPTSLGAFKLESSRPRMYANAKNDGVIAIDTDRDQVVGRFSVAPAGTNAAIAIDEPHRRLFIGCRQDPSLVVMDSDSGKVVARLPIPGDVDDLSFDPRGRRIYASCGEGAIAVIRQVDADRYESLGTIATAKRARTSIFNPETGHLYLAVPRLAERPEQEDPEVWVYEARP